MRAPKKEVLQTAAFILDQHNRSVEERTMHFDLLELAEVIDQMAVVHAEARLRHVLIDQCKDALCAVKERHRRARLLHYLKALETVRYA